MGLGQGPPTHLHSPRTLLLQWPHKALSNPHPLTRPPGTPQADPLQLSMPMVNPFLQNLLGRPLQIYSLVVTLQQLAEPMALRHTKQQGQPSPPCLHSSQCPQLATGRRRCGRKMSTRMQLTTTGSSSSSSTVRSRVVQPAQDTGTTHSVTMSRCQPSQHSTLLLGRWQLQHPPQQLPSQVPLLPRSLI